MILSIVVLKGNLNKFDPIKGIETAVILNSSESLPYLNKFDPIKGIETVFVDFSFVHTFDTEFKQI